MRIFLVAGEASSDMNASAVVRELRKRREDLQFFGVGGERLREAGMDIRVPAEKINVVGVWDWAERWGEILDTYRGLRETVRTEKIDCAVLLDLPDLNLRLAKHLKAQNIPIIYYTPPQVWAWRKYRVETIRKYIDRLLVVFPFEAEFYARERIQAQFVGHPLRELVHPRSSYRSDAEVEASPRIALLPGSRRSEVRNHAPVLAEVARIIRREIPTAQFQLPVASTLKAEFVREHLGSSEEIELSPDAHRTLHWADVAVVASGTATLETSLIGTPFSLLYKMSPTTAFAMKYVFGYRGFLGLPNVLSGRKVVEEFLHRGATPEPIAQHTLRMIRDSAVRRSVAQDLQNIAQTLGSQGASRSVADVVEQVLDRSSV